MNAALPPGGGNTTASPPADLELTVQAGDGTATSPATLRPAGSRSACAHENG